MYPLMFILSVCSAPSTRHSLPSDYQTLKDAKMNTDLENLLELCSALKLHGLSERAMLYDMMTDAWIEEFDQFFRDCLSDPDRFRRFELDKEKAL